MQSIRTKGSHYIPVVLQLFQAKVLAQFLYGSQLGPFPNIITLEERVQSKFLRAALGIPRDVSSVKLKLESGQIKIEARAWVAILTHWLRVPYLPVGLASLILQDKSNWVQVIEQKIASLGLPMLTLLNMGLEQAKENL